MVAIKKLLSADYKQHEMNFIYNGPKLQHKNIVKCLGYGVEKNVNWIRLYKNITCAEKLPIWVEEYVPNGSLEKFLINDNSWDSPGVTRATYRPQGCEPKQHPPCNRPKLGLADSPPF